jgi:hypothetical protein
LGTAFRQARLQPFRPKHVRAFSDRGNDRAHLIIDPEQQVRAMLA